ncbi:YqkE family protein [Microbacteriaceae bacterium 4G12]
MAKKKKQHTAAKVEKESVSLGEHLNSALVQQLKQKQKELAQREEKQKAEESERKRKEQREREKNKTFEELFGESNLSWKDFK